MTGTTAEKPPVPDDLVVSHGDHEVVFRTYPNGNPPGQVKAFMRKQGRGEKRIALAALPTAALQRTFVGLTGKTPEELGLRAGGGGW